MPLPARKNPLSRFSLFTSLAALTAVAAFGTVGCASDEEAAIPGEHLAVHRQPIIDGKASTADQDSVIQLAISVQGRLFGYCSGTLIAKNLVLTARHCVGELSDTDGTVTNFEPSTIKVFTGADAPQKVERGSAPAASGKTLFTKATKQLIPDMALLVLDKQVTAPVAAIRVTGGATDGEALTIIGFGIDSSNAAPPTRMQRSGVSVFAIGPTTTSFHELAEGEFAFGEAACSGDSGGPAIDSKTKAVVGVASRVSNGKDRTQEDPSAFCIGSKTEDVYSSLAPIENLITAAFKAAGATPILEGKEPPAPPTTDPKDEPKDDDEKPATPAKSTPRSTTTTSSGCAAAPSGTANGGGIGLVIAAVAAAFVSRRRRAS